MAIKLVLVTQEDGCVVPTSHALNRDGYFRKRVGGKLQMYHRYCWEQENGEIPEGYEVDHKCKNRACCNTNHLQLLTSTAHRTKDNTGRNGSRKGEAHQHWLIHNNTGTSLAAQFGVSFSAACKWIREWKE